MFNTAMYSVGFGETPSGVPFDSLELALSEARARLEMGQKPLCIWEYSLNKEPILFLKGEEFFAALRDF